jgi:hypothetical protein
MSSPPGLSELEDVLQKQLREVHTTIDKSSNYSRMVLGLGYGGYFAVWAGTKQYLPPKYVVLSALSLVVSSFLFIAFHVLEAACFSVLSVRSSKVTAADAQSLKAKAESFFKSSRRVSSFIGIVWMPIFAVSLLTGIGGVALLVGGFCKALRGMW